jgi:hypothetical protein
METAHKMINLIWRDENYGPISGVVAFRAVIEPYPSETQKKKVTKAYKAAGFELNHHRQSWISHEAETAPIALAAALEDLDYVITHCGAQPTALDTPRVTSTPSSPRM